MTFLHLIMNELVICDVNFEELVISKRFLRLFSISFGYGFVTESVDVC